MTINVSLNPQTQRPRAESTEKDYAADSHRNARTIACALTTALPKLSWLHVKHAHHVGAFGETGSNVLLNIVEKKVYVFTV